MIDQQQRPADVTHAKPIDNGTATPISGTAPTQLNQVDDNPAVETPVEARGGFLGKPVALVLGVSLVLAVLAGVLIGYIPL